MKPAMLFLNIILLPLILAALISFLLTVRYEILLPLGILLLLYALGVFVFLKASFFKTNYLIVRDGHLDLCGEYPYVDKETGHWIVSYCDIVCFDYYRMTSLKGWCTLYTGVVPKCVYMTVYDSRGAEQSILIGYMELSQIQDIAKRGNVDLVIH